jgi:hypothetical protein
MARLCHAARLGLPDIAPPTLASGAVLLGRPAERPPLGAA